MNQKQNERGKEGTLHTWIHEGMLCFSLLLCVDICWTVRPLGHGNLWKHTRIGTIVLRSRFHGWMATWHVTMDTRHLPSASTELHLSAEQTVKLSNGQAVEVVKLHTRFIYIYVYIIWS